MALNSSIMYTYGDIITVVMSDCFCVDYEEDEWPSDLGEPKRSIPPSNGSTALPATGLKRFATRKNTDTQLYKMAVTLAAVAVGFDIRISNTTAIHPQLHNSEDDTRTVVPSQRKKGEFIGKRRDAYFAAVRDSFIEPELNFSTASGYNHNTYHGNGVRSRPSVNFNAPMRFTESKFEGLNDHTTPSSDVTGTTPGSAYSASSAYSSSPSPLKSLHSDDGNDLALISLSPSQDRTFIERQMSDTSSSVFETPKSTPKTTPQRYNVTFEDDDAWRSPSKSTRRYSPSSNSSTPSHNYNSGTTTQPHVDGSDRSTCSPVICPPPPRRHEQGESNNLHHSTAERPVTLDIIPRPRPNPSILKKMSVSPAHTAVTSTTTHSHVTPTPSDISSSGDQASFMSSYSVMSPGSTPPHVRHQTTLLDIDVDGQWQDSTKPLPARRQGGATHLNNNKSS